MLQELSRQLSRSSTRVLQCPKPLNHTTRKPEVVHPTIILSKRCYSTTPPKTCVILQDVQKRAELGALRLTVVYPSRSNHTQACSAVQLKRISTENAQESLATISVILDEVVKITPQSRKPAPSVELQSNVVDPLNQFAWQISSLQRRLQSAKEVWEGLRKLEVEEADEAKKAKAIADAVGRLASLTEEPSSLHRRAVSLID